MPTINVRYKPGEFHPDDMPALAEKLPKFISERFNSYSEQPFEPDHVEMFFDKMNPHDVTKHAIIITIIAKKTPQRIENQEVIGDEILLFFEQAFPCDANVKLLLVDSTWHSHH